MKTTVSLHDFRTAFHDMGRASHFSYDGLEILFDYIEEIEEDCGEEIEFDVIGLCCDFAEASHTEIARDYSVDLSSYDGDDTAEHDAVVQYLENQGCFIGTTDLGMIVYRQH